MSYVLDEKADEIVAGHAELQRAIRGMSMMFATPGYGSYLLANAGMTFGWMGSSLAVYGSLGPTATRAVYYLGTSGIVVGIMSALIYRVLRGHASGRRWMFAYALWLVLVGIACVAVAIVQAHRGAIGVGVIGLFASSVACRCIAGANYALLAAFFRAKRVYGTEVEDELRRLRNARRK